MDSLDALDRRAGNGAANVEDDWLDDNSTADENQWSTAQTTFYVDDAPDHKRERFEELYEKHNGWGERTRDKSIRRTHIVNDAKTFCSILELPKPQRKRVVKIAREMNFSTNRFGGGRTYEKVLLAVCSLVSDEALMQKIQEPDGDAFEQRIVLTDEFKELMEMAEMGSSEHHKIRRQLREKTDYF